MSKSAWKSKYRYIKGCLRLIILLFSAGIISCKKQFKKQEADRAFYHWKTVLNLSEHEVGLLDTLKVSTLYIKYFDVDWDPEKGAAVPKANLRVQKNIADRIDIIPCIFITNSCIANVDSSSLNQLSLNILKLIDEINASLDKPVINELQIDCDWTATTSKKYFSLLKLIRQNISKSSVSNRFQLSCTIRLHQIKFLGRTGVPPVDRGLLMAYNMGNLKDPRTNNSILEVDELKKYIGSLATYPLQLDVALPAFEWIVLFRDNVYAGLIQHYSAQLLQIEVCHKLSENRFGVNADILVDGYQLKKGDMLRVEKSEYNEILQAITSIKEKHPGGAIKLAIYHLDSLTLSKYQLHEMETIFNRFN